MKTDVILFTVCLVVGALFPVLAFGSDVYSRATVDIQFHDVYFVVSPAEIALVVTGLLTFLVFLIRSLKASLRTKLSLIFLGLGGMTMILLALFGFRVLESMHNGNYPS